jgi:hypothetical protein
MAYDNPDELLSLIFLITSVFAAHPPDRNRRTTQAASPFALVQAPRLPRLRLARITLNLSLRIARTIKRPRRTWGMRLSGAEQGG